MLHEKMLEFMKFSEEYRVEWRILRLWHQSDEDVNKS